MRPRKATNCALVQVLMAAVAVYGQRVAPGVPPQHYQPVAAHQQQQQHPQQQQQYQQQHQQQQQMHGSPGVAPVNYQQQQYQQVPIQQQQYQQNPPQQQQQQHQVPQGQPPPQQQQQQQQHHDLHHPHGQPQQVLHVGNIQEERAHIQEHMPIPIDTSQMSESELQFHYFKMHDTDNNNKLDGCELIKSLIHWHEQGSKEPHHEQKPHVEEKVFSDEELVALIDPIMETDDLSRDGFIDYPEFIEAQRKAQQQQQQQQPPAQQPPQQQPQQTPPQK